MIQVLPSIIPQDKKQLALEMERAASFAATVQVDIADGGFVSPKTWPYNGRDTDFFQSLSREDAGWPQWEKLDVEVHLMVSQPEEVVGEWIHTGVSAAVAHIEASKDFQKFIDACRASDVGVGIALKPSTPISAIAPFVSHVDFIQCMGADELGRHGVWLDPKALETIRSLRREFPDVIISIDIGVTEETAEELAEAGANKFIVGSALLGAEHPKEIYDYFQSLG